MGNCASWLSLALLLLACGAGCCLQITGMKVPRMVVTGESIQLSCSFRLDGAQLYTLTWWKDSHIFYKFNPKRSPPSVVFPLPGITVDDRVSSLYQVTLSHVDHRASGTLRCEVLSDSPSFEQDTMDANITVIAKPVRGPSITGLRGSYTAGRLLLLNCTCPFSYPPTSLTWHINGHQASRETVVVYPGVPDGQGREASWSGLHMWLRREHFQQGGVLVLRCTASILTVYRKSSEVTVTDSSYVGSPPPEGASTAGEGWCVGPAVPLLMLLQFSHAVT
ncbi:uncharacterized protein [Procambarus clarkii]|uniref:uncharacterized protein n=1 Tax=Procambarus clarkii TaxID=6728 RepID=UPI003741F9F5